MSDDELSQEIIKIIIADDQQIVRESLQLQLAKEPYIEVVASVDSGSAALAKIAELTPNVILIDLEMPGMDGVTAIKQICDRFPLTKPLVFSIHDEREYINQAIVAGAKGYLLKGTATKDLVDTIRNVHRGYFQLGSGILDKLSLSGAQTSLNVVDNVVDSSPKYCVDIIELVYLEAKLTDKFTSMINFKSKENYDKFTRMINLKSKEERDQFSAILSQQRQLLNSEKAKIYSKIKTIEFQIFIVLAIQTIWIIAIISQR